MSDTTACESVFEQILQKLKEEHHKEILQLRTEHAREILQLQAECAKYKHQSTLELQLDPEQDESGKTAAANCNPSPFAVVAESDVMIVANADAPPRAGSSDEPTPQPINRKSGKASSILKEDNKILGHLVSQHMRHMRSTDSADVVGGLMDKYAMARGWEVRNDATRMFGTPQVDTRIQKFVTHRNFDGFCACAITLNTALLGVITSKRAVTLGTEELPAQYDIFSTVFSCWFLCELTLRWASEGLCAFILSSPNLAWNFFDVFVVGVDIVEIIVKLTTGGESKALANLNVMRMLRVLRIARALRVVRLLKFCKELRQMVLSLLRSGMMLVWCLLLLSVTFYMFSIFVMQAVTEHLSERVSESGSLRFPKESTEGKLDQYFGTLTMTMYMLFQSVTGGISWGELADLLLETGVSTMVIFCLFVFFTFFAMLNIINGYFVEAAMSSVHRDEDEVIQEEMKSENASIRQLHHIFQEADTDERGWITEDQFKSLVENPRVNALLKGLGLNVSEARGLFALLDLELTGAVSIDDFIIGCMRLRGDAQEVDLISLMYESRKLLASQLGLAAFVKTEFERLDKFEDRVDYCLKALGTCPVWAMERRAISEVSEPPLVHL